MTTRRRTAALTVPLAAAALLMLGAVPAHADCMTDDKGNQVCGDSGSGPASGPGSYSGTSGINNGTVGAIGPDGRPMTGATPQPWMQPGYSPPPLPASMQPAPNPGGPANFVPPPVQAVVPNTTGTSPKELPPAGVGSAAGSTGGSNIAGSQDGEPASGAESTAGPTSSAAASATPSGPVVAMTDRPERGTPPTQAATAPEALQSAPASEESPFNPLPLILGVVAVLVAAGAVFVPGIRSAVAGLFRFGRH